MPAPSFPKLTLIQKMSISFVVSGLFMLAGLAYSISSMGAMHRVEEFIARNHLAAATTSISLHDILLAQERHVARYRIFQQPELRELFEQNSTKFMEGLTKLRQMNPEPSVEVLATEYSRFHGTAIKLLSNQVVPPAEVRRAVERVAKAIEQLRAEQQLSLEQKLKESDDQESRTVFISIGLAIGGVVIAFTVAFLMIYSFATSIGKLQRATHRIADGDFNHELDIPPGDEIGALAQDFSRMAERLKQLELISLDASPLTRLPGNIAIERSLNRRLKENATFVMCYMDLDNFKSYNDRYGYIKASELIKETARLIHDAVLLLDDPEAFVGHIGGDDFVAIVNADKADAVCCDIIRNFDRMIPLYYSDEDRTVGAINGIDRYGVPRLFPLVSISIAALACHPGDYDTAAEIATVAAKVKDQVKGTSGSNYMIIRKAELYET